MDNIKDNLENISQYYEGLIYFSINNVDKNEEAFIKNFSNKLNSESSIVIVDYKNKKRNKIEEKLSDKLKNPETNKVDSGSRAVSVKISNGEVVCTFSS